MRKRATSSRLALAGGLALALALPGCGRVRASPPELAEIEAPPAVLAEQLAARHDPHASVFERSGQGEAECDFENWNFYRTFSRRVEACPGNEEFRWDDSRLPASPRQRRMWWALAHQHAGDCEVLRNAASWLVAREHRELDRQLAPRHPELVQRYRSSGVLTQVASRTHALETVQCAAEMLGPLPERLQELHGLWLYRAGWVFLYAGRMTAYQRVHAELARRDGALDRFLFAHLQGLEAIRAGDMARAEKLLMDSVRRDPEELHESLSGASLLVREFWVRERVDVVVDYLEAYAAESGDEAWAQTTLDSVLRGHLPDEGWL